MPDAAPDSAAPEALPVNSKGDPFAKADRPGISIRDHHRKAKVRDKLHMGWSPLHAAKMIEIYVHMHPGRSGGLLLKLTKGRI